MLTVKSVIEWINDSTNTKFERILWISPDKQLAVVYPLGEKNGFPKYAHLGMYYSSLENNDAIKRTEDPFIRFKLPMPESSAYKRRDFYWLLIEKIVNDEPDIYDPKLRGVMIKEVMNTYHVKYKDVMKYLRRYWQCGMVKDALFPENEKKGGKGKSRAIVTDPQKSQSKFEGRGGKRGRKSRIEISHSIVGVSVTEDAKKIFNLAYQKFYVEEKLPLTKTYEKMLRVYFNINHEAMDGRQNPILPPLERRYTFNEFRYWVKKNENIRKTLINRNTIRTFNLKNREVLGTTGKMADGPGKLYQVDSTIADILLVSSLDPRLIIGRPILYLVSDTFSRKIVGLYVGLEDVKWESYAMAFANALENKVDFCKKYGIIIQSDTWNATFVPEQVITDRGPEFIGENSTMLVNAFGTHVSNTPPYRPDWKPIVEREFGILNKETIHWLPGSTQGRQRERGERPAARDAILTLHDFTAILIQTILTFNRSHFIDKYPMTKEMISDGVRPIPEELWSWGIANASGRLREVDPRVLKLNLLPRATATVTRKGIEFKGMHYSCPRAIRENWFLRAQDSGTWKIKIAYDRRWTNAIYLIDENGQPIPCELLPKDEETFINRRLEEVEEYFVQKQIKKQLHDEAQARANRDSEIESIVENAKKRTRSALKSNSMSKTRREKISAEERAMERERNRFEEAFDLRLPKSTVQRKNVPAEENQTPMGANEKWNPRPSKAKKLLGLLEEFT